MGGLIADSLDVVLWKDARKDEELKRNATEQKRANKEAEKRAADELKAATKELKKVESERRAAEKKAETARRNAEKKAHASMLAQRRKSVKQSAKEKLSEREAICIQQCRNKYRPRTLRPHTN